MFVLEGLLVLLIIYTTLIVVGFAYIILNIKHIVIWNRRPYLVCFEQVCGWFWLLFVYLNFPCLIAQSIGTLILCSKSLRVLYALQYLVDDPAEPLKFISHLFWRRNSFIMRNAVIYIIISALFKVGYVILIFTVYDQDFVNQSCLEIEKDWPTLTNLLNIPLGIVIIAAMIITIYLYLINAKDKIGLKHEFGWTTSFSVFLLVLFIILKVYFVFPFIWSTIAQVLNLYVWSIWVPIYYVYKHNKKTRHLLISGYDCDMGALLNMSRQLFCEENVLFIKQYRDFRQASSDCHYKQILRDFVEPDAKFELNITENERLNAFNSPNGLEAIYDDVIELVRTNILPYLHECRDSELP